MLKTDLQRTVKGKERVLKFKFTNLSGIE